MRIFIRVSRRDPGAGLRVLYCVYKGGGGYPASTLGV